jgi:diacylglycerol kinase family enzyme
MEPIPVLMNSRAGLARPAGEIALARVLAEHHVHAVIEEVAPGELGQHLRRLAGQPMVGVAGGDGTQRTAARILAGSGSILVPFPTGTLNHFARRLGLADLDAAAQAVRTGTVRAMPVGRANGRVFMNTAVTGSYPGFIRLRERLRPFLTKWPATGVAALHVLATLPRVTVEVRTPGAADEYRTPLLWVGIGAGSYPAPHEAPPPMPDDGLEVVILTRGGRIAAFRLAAATARLWRGRSNGLGRAARFMRAPWIQIDSPHPIPMALDGERRLIHPPITLRYEPGALRVMAADGRAAG